MPAPGPAFAFLRQEPAQIGGDIDCCQRTDRPGEDWLGDGRRSGERTTVASIEGGRAVALA
ncbi:hypothetical protein CPBF367_36080 [Xanthomonas arboricola pv. juglandis]|nr:hypothetical protein CPBF367_36080 [Xanthomonas arboricola pv. juglandis]